MKTAAIILVLVVLFSSVPLAYAQGDEIYYSTYLVLESEVRSSLEIKRQAGASIDYVEAELYYFPMEDKRQTVLEVKTEPKADAVGDKFVFRWDSPSENLLQYRVKSRVQVENMFEKVYNKIEFPLTEGIPADIAEYTNPTEKIDSGNRAIINLANSIAEGEDDLLIVVHKLAVWVKENIEYSLSTVTAEATQKASWVIENKQGVCDELTALFMALSRSVGIPARFVSGISYTDDPQFPEKWGAHGWAEIYLPGYGWVPFDVTYGELGWIDPSHIKLSESIDPDKASGRIEWKGRDFEVVGGKIELSAEIKETGGRILDTVEINTKVLKRETGFGSYNLVEADINNLRSYYVTTDISLSAPEEIEIDGKQNRQIILKPGETEKVFWILKVNPNLDRGYVYTFPTMAYNQRNTSDTTEFKVSYDEPVYAYDEIKELLTHFEEEGKEEKKYEKDVGLKCDAAKDEFYVYEENALSCVVENKGNTVISDLDVCFSKDCKKIDLMIAQKKEIRFEISKANEGERNLIVTAKNSGVSETDYVPVVVLDIPNATVAEINYPAEASYKEIGTIEFDVMKESFSKLYNANVRLESNRIRKEWVFDEIDKAKRFILEFSANDLAEGDNEFSIIVDYEDRNGRKYSTKEDFTIRLKDLTLFQKISVKIKGIGFFILNLF